MVPMELCILRIICTHPADLPLFNPRPWVEPMNWLARHPGLGSLSVSSLYTIPTAGNNNHMGMFSLKFLGFNQDILSGRSPLNYRLHRLNSVFSFFPLDLLPQKTRG